MTYCGKMLSTILGQWEVSPGGFEYELLEEGAKIQLLKALR